MKYSAKECPWHGVQPWRERHRRAMACQIVHDSLHERTGWPRWFQLEAEGTVAGYGAIVVEGPWQGTRTAFELHVGPEHRACLLELAAAFVHDARVDQIVAQTNDPTLTLAALQQCPTLAAEKVIFAEGSATTLPAGGASLRRTADFAASRIFAHAGEPVGDWALEKNGEVIATGGYFSHYNPPYVDLYLEVSPPFRRQGYGSFLLQELKRIARAAGKIPCGRCTVGNLGSQMTMARAGMQPCAHVIGGKASASAPAPPKPPPMNANGSTPAVVIQNQLDAFNTRDLATLLAIYADDAELFEHPDKLLAKGTAALRDRFAVRFAEPNLHAELLNRMVMGDIVIDHEKVTRTFPEGPGSIELIMTYEVKAGRITRAWTKIGPKLI